MSMHPDVERVALLGWHLYPSSNRSRAACFKGASDAATHDLDQLEQWSREYPGCNWRVVVGPSGLWGLDCDVAGVDHAADGIAALKRLTEQHGELPARPTLRSGGGGLAIFFMHAGEPITGRTGTPEAGIDPRRGKLSQTIPPSRHHRTGRAYRWLAAPWEVNPPAAPAWLLDLVKPPPEPPRPPLPQYATTDRARRVLMRAAGRVMDAGEGTRNDTLNRQSFTVARFVAAGLLGEHEALDTLYAAARQVGLAHPEIKATLQSAFRSGFRRPVEAAWSAQ